MRNLQLLTHCRVSMACSQLQQANADVIQISGHDGMSLMSLMQQLLPNQHVKMTRDSQGRCGVFLT